MIQNEQNAGIALDQQHNPQLDQSVMTLFSEQDNADTFRDLLSAAGSDRRVLDALIAARFTRAHYLNGSVPQEFLDPEQDIDKELIRLVREVDTETIENENVKLAYGLLNASINMRESDQGGMRALAPPPARIPTSVLLSETLSVSSPDTSGAIMDQVKFGLKSESRNSKYTTSDVWEQQALILAALPEKIGFTPDSATRDIEILHHAIDVISAMDARINGTELEEPATCSPATKQDFEIFKNAYNQMFMQVAGEGFGLSEEAATVALNVFTPKPTSSASSVHSLFAYSGVKEQGIRRLMESFKSPLAKDLFEKQIVEVAPEKDGQKGSYDRLMDLEFREGLQRGVVEYISISSDPGATLEDIHDMFNDPLLSDYLSARRLAGHRGQAVEGIFGSFSVVSGRIEDGQFAFLKNRDHINEALSDPVVGGIIKRLEAMSQKDGSGDVEHVHRKSRLENLLGDLLVNKEALSIIQSYRESGVFDEMLSDYDNLSAFIVSNTGHMTDLFSGIEKTLGEYYKRIKNASTSEEVAHYSRNIADLFMTMRAFDFKESARQSYLGFISKTGLSAKEEQRSLRLFSNLASVIDDGEHIPDFNSADEIEVFIFERTLKSVGVEGNITLDQLNAIKEAFGGDIEPISTYVQRFCRDEEYSTVFKGMLESIVAGSFTEWKYGLIEEGGFEQMKAAGHIPVNISIDQYRAWMAGSVTSIESELQTSAEDVSAEIHRAVQLASADLSMIAPGFELTEEYAGMLQGARSALGQTIGVLHRFRGMKDGYTEEQLIDEISKKIEGGQHPFIDFVKHGITEAGAGIDVKIEIVEKFLAKADTLNNLIRIASLRPQEILEDSLLTEEGKRQKELSSVLSEIKSELPEEVAFIPDTVQRLIEGYKQMHAGRTKLEVMDTDSPKTTVEIGEKPLRSCQHYASGGFSEGLVGYFGPDVKIIAAFNESGNIVGRSIVRLMQDQNGDPVLYAEPTYISIPSSSLSGMMREHLEVMSERMGGVRYGGALGTNRGDSSNAEEVTVQSLKMPVAYSDGAYGLNRGTLTLTI